MFVPGKSGNPGGRPKKSEKKKSFEQQCKEAVLDVIPQMVAEISNTDNSLKDRLSTFELLCSHGFGKPVDRIAIAQVGGGSNAVEDMTTEQLIQAARQQIAYEEAEDAEVIESTPASDLKSD